MNIEDINQEYLDKIKSIKDKSNLLERVKNYRNLNKMICDYYEKRNNENTKDKER